MKLEKAIALSFFTAMGGMFLAFPGIFFKSDAMFLVGMGWAMFFGVVMFLLIVYEVATS